ncbi:Zinc finger protein 112-like 3, partial [Homarus americanus]
MRVHTGEKPITGFTRSWYLRRHMNVHTREKTKPCMKCKKSFSNIYTLEAHTKNVNCTGEPNLKSCSVCNKEFRSDSNLEMHMRTHTGEKPFKCSTCKKVFMWSDELKKHKSSHSSKKSSQICVICKKEFKSSANLTIHMYFHFGKESSLKSKDNKNDCDITSDTRDILQHTAENPLVGLCEQSSSSSFGSPSNTATDIEGRWKDHYNSNTDQVTGNRSTSRQSPEQQVLCAELLRVALQDISHIPFINFLKASFLGDAGDV